MNVYQPINMSPVLVLDNEAAAWLNLQAMGGQNAAPSLVQRILQSGMFDKAAREDAIDLDACGLLDRKTAAEYLAAKGMLVQVIDGFIGTVTSLNSDTRHPSVREYKSEPLVLLSLLPSTSSMAYIKQVAASTGAFPDDFNWEDRRVAINGCYPDA